MKQALSIFTFLACIFLPACAYAFLSDYASYDVPNVPRPTLDVPYMDKVFGSSVIRRTDPAEVEGSCGLIQEYAKYSPVNSDGSLVAVQVICGSNRGSWRIQGLADHTWRATLKTQGDPEISWHPTDPNLLLYRRNNALLRYRVDTGQTEPVLKADAYVSISTNQEGRPSVDWRYWAGIGVRSDGTRDILVADLQSRTIIATLRSVTKEIDWVSMSMSGQFVVVQYTDGKGTLVYDRNLVFQRQVIADFTHADLALDSSGQDILVYIAVTGAQVSELGCPNAPSGSPIAAARLGDGQKKILLGDCYTADWQPVITGVFLPWGGAYHFSGIISKARPGWVLVSTYADNNVPQAPFSREMFSLATDGSGRVERLAHHHSITQGDYWGEPHATSSWDGTKVFFASTWASTDRYDLYAIGSGSPIPPPIPPDDNGQYNCLWVFSRQPDGSLAGFRASCTR